MRITRWILAKWLLAIVAGGTLLFAAAVLIATSVIDPNRYRGKIEAIVADLAGRPLVIEGTLEITWYPWLGLRMGAAHLDNLPVMQGQPLIEWQSIAARARLLPLLRGQVIVDRVRLKGAHIRLRRDPQGHGNWENMGVPPSTPLRPQSSPAQIAGIEISDGELEYADEVSGLHFDLSSWQFEMGAWQSSGQGAPFPVHTRFLARGDSLPPTGLWTQIDVPELTVGFSPVFIQAPQLSVRVADAQIKGPLTFERIDDAHFRANGSVSVQVPSVRKLATDLALEISLPRDPTTLGPLELASTWSFTDGAFTAKPLSMQLDGTKLTGWVERSAPSQAAWRFELHGDRIDLGRYADVGAKKKKPFELPVDALRALRATGSVTFDQAQLAGTNLNNVRLRLQSADDKR